MVGRKDRLQEEGQRAQERLLGTDLPVVDDRHLRPYLLEGPDAAAYEFAEGLERESVRATRFDDPEPPAQGIEGSQPLV